MLERLYTDGGPAQVQAMLMKMGRELGLAAAASSDTVDGLMDGHVDAAVTLAAQLDGLGYEAQAMRHGGEMQVEAYDCVFHALARDHPEVCRFDVAFMEAASGRSIDHLECLVRGGNACRFRLGPADASAAALPVD